ncbi:hypothetical protein [Sphaerisporangium fuscum]|uniref:hypothetical protein n=1 Tax=Sphaerisporangium fuscum TaxID=2835868 RepID=UPI001BDD8F02|nr:hypothetical protein [Sphaerisporangium fuscum]
MNGRELPALLMYDTDWTQVVGAAGLLTLLIVVVTVVAWQIGAGRRARMLLDRELWYRKLAEDGLAVQQSTERQLAELTERLAAVQARMDSIERILEQVE